MTMTAAIFLLLVMQAGNGVDFRVDKEVYMQGERVCFEFVNRTPKPVQLPNPNPWMVVDEKDGIIFSPLSTQVIANVQPAGRKRWCWDQRRADGNLVVPGRYFLQMNAYINGEKKMFQKIIEIVAEYIR